MCPSSSNQQLVEPGCVAGGLAPRPLAPLPLLPPEHPDPDKERPRPQAGASLPSPSWQVCCPLALGFPCLYFPNRTRESPRAIFVSPFPFPGTSAGGQDAPPCPLHSGLRTAPARMRGPGRGCLTILLFFLPLLSPSLPRYFFSPLFLGDLEILLLAGTQFLKKCRAWERVCVIKERRKG